MTEKIPMRKFRTAKAVKDVVTAKPIVVAVVQVIRPRTSWRLWTRSPRGEINSTPTAYL